MVGCEFPLFAFSHCRDVVAAVSRAGGFGVLGAVGHTPESLEIELSWIDEQVGDKPYGVDLIVPTALADREGSLTPEELQERVPPEHRRHVENILAEHGIDTAGLWDAQDYECVLYGMDFLGPECDEWFGSQRPDPLLSIEVAERLKMAPSKLPSHAKWLQQFCGMPDYAVHCGVGK